MSHVWDFPLPGFLDIQHFLVVSISTGFIQALVQVFILWNFREKNNQLPDKS